MDMFGKNKTNNDKMVWLWATIGAIIASVGSFSTISKHKHVAEKNQSKLPPLLKVLKWGLLIGAVISVVAIWYFFFRN